MAKFQEIIKIETLGLVDFFADWCSPCKALSPILKEIKNEFGHHLKIVKIDVDRH